MAEMDATPTLTVYGSHLRCQDGCAAAWGFPSRPACAHSALLLEAGETRQGPEDAAAAAGQWRRVRPALQCPLGLRSGKQGKRVTRRSAVRWLVAACRDYTRTEGTKGTKGGAREEGRDQGRTESVRMHGHGMGGPPTWIGEEAGAEAQQGVHMRPRGLQRSVHCRSWIPARR